VTASVFESITQTPNPVQEIKKISDALASLISPSPPHCIKNLFCDGQRLLLDQKAIRSECSNGQIGSLPTFAALAQKKKLADTLSVRFLRAALSISHLQRRSAIRP
jgi:hypothetical protein